MDRSDPTGGFDVMHAELLQFFPELVTRLGGDPAALLREGGIAERARATSYRQMAALFELAAARLDCADFGMQLAMLQMGTQVYGPIGGVMRNSRTFGDALEYVSDHAYAHNLAARVWLRRYPVDGAVFVGHDILVDRAPGMSQAIEEILLVGHFGAMEMTGGKARARRVDFRHQPVSPIRLYRRNFGCEVRFGRNADGIWFSDSDMAAPILDSDAQAYRIATSVVDGMFERRSPPFGALVRGVVMQFLGTELCTNERVAIELNLHPRSLHRRLAAEGTSFQQVKDEVRRDAMLYYVRQTDMDFARISERLGFAEQSVMTRRCNRWFGASPTRLRMQARAELSETVKPGAGAVPQAIAKA